MSCKIKCIAFRENMRDWEVTTDGKLWPCCYYSNSWEGKHRLILNDKKIMQEFEKDPDWNDITKYGLDAVVEHEIFNEYIWFPGWNSDSPPELCVRECSVVADDYTGTEKARSRIQLNTD